MNDANFGDEYDGATVADVRWGDVNLAVVEWSYPRRKRFRTQMVSVKLGDEREAGRDVTWIGEPKDAATRRRDYDSAVRAYRQLATALRAQGMHEDADRYAYQAQVFNRQVLQLQRRWGTVFGSWLLDRIAGYGYRPLRAVGTYLLVICGFAAAYYLLGSNVHPSLTPIDAVVFSVTSFHGRGFSAGESATLHNPVTILAAIEAIIGLVIEITFIATFTQRFFAR